MRAIGCGVCAGLGARGVQDETAHERAALRAADHSDARLAEGGEGPERGRGVGPRQNFNRFLARPVPRSGALAPAPGQGAGRGGERRFCGRLAALARIRALDGTLWRLAQVEAAASGAHPRLPPHRRRRARARGRRRGAERPARVGGESHASRRARGSTAAPDSR
ncbi:hypothetical protein T492DRAFT_174954 [Pavlovales sp. CCMP2436]|nr:hypothetical protein T492DRAFT_174954 [Pavlovales sp. CCMP2436]